MNRFSLIALISFAIFSLAFVSRAALLPRMLSLGDSGEDVRTLQKLLNYDPRTTVALSGAGSLGNETIYFGELTRNAVIKFQELYARDILIPAGLAEGSGYVGSLTRKKLDELYGRFPPQEADIDISTQVFLRNLSLGDSGADVKRLQEILNDDIRTRVAFSGAGSRGNETTYFGELTRNAVIKFQELYAADILSPVGLSKGTGYVGPSTRQKLNTLASADGKQDAVPTEGKTVKEEISLSDGIGVPPTIEETPSTEIFVESSDLILSFPSRYEAERGEQITLYGSGFTKIGNTVYVGSRTISNLVSSNGTTLSFSIPDAVELGKHSVYVINENGTSNKNLFVVVLGTSTERPSIAAITPSEGGYGTEVVITGSGFTRDGNEIRASYGIIEDIPSLDGNTLTFTVLPPSEVLDFKASGKGEVNLPVWFYIVNDNGISTKPAEFTLHL